MWSTSSPQAANQLHVYAQNIRQTVPYAVPDQRYQAQYEGMATQADSMAASLDNRNIDSMYGAGTSDPNNPLNYVDR